MKNRIKTLLLFISILISTSAHAITYSTTSSGDWMTPGKWTPAGPPSSGSNVLNRNVIIIQAGHTITISGEDISLSHMIIYIYGILNMDNSGLDYANLNLTGTGSGIIIQPGGRLTESSILHGFLNIRVNGVVEWNGSDGNITAGGTRITLPSSGVDDPLPVTMLDWKAEKKHDNILTSWSTSFESDNAYFTIEESKDGINFDAIATISSKGNSTSIQEYNYTFAPQTGNTILYYRLKQTDLNGEFNYSSIVSVSFDLVLETWKTFPNPVSNGEFFIQSFGSEISEISFQNIQSGQEILHQEFSDYEPMIKVVLPSNIQAGLYLLSVINKGNKITRPIMVH